MKDGRLPPRLVGGVTYELDEKLRDTGAANGLEGRQDSVMENKGFEVIGRGMEDGEAWGGIIEADERGSDGGGVIITGKVTADGDG